MPWATWLVGTGSGVACGTCEQAARTLSRTEFGVCGWNCTTASCLPKVASKEEQPAPARARARTAASTAQAAGGKRCRPDRGGAGSGGRAGTVPAYGGPGLGPAGPRPAPGPRPPGYRVIDTEPAGWLTGRNLPPGEFTVPAGEQVIFVLTWMPSHERGPPWARALDALARTGRFCQDWAARCTYQGLHREAVTRDPLPRAYRDRSARPAARRRHVGLSPAERGAPAHTGGQRA